MIIYGLLISVMLLILVEAGVLVLGTFYIWLPLLVSLGIVVLQVILLLLIKSRQKKRVTFNSKRKMNIR